MPFGEQKDLVPVCGAIAHSGGAGRGDAPSSPRRYLGRGAGGGSERPRPGRPRQKGGGIQVQSPLPARRALRGQMRAPSLRRSLAERPAGCSIRAARPRGPPARVREGGGAGESSGGCRQRPHPRTWNRSRAAAVFPGHRRSKRAGAAARPGWSWGAGKARPGWQSEQRGRRGALAGSVQNPQQAPGHERKSHRTHQTAEK